MASEVAQQIIRETCREHGVTVDEAFVELKHTSACVVARRETYVALYLAGFSHKEISEETDVAYSPICRSLRNSGIELRPKYPKWGWLELAFLGRMRDSDVVERINELVNCGRLPVRRLLSSVRNKRRQLGIAPYRQSKSTSPRVIADAKLMSCDEWCDLHGLSRATYYVKRKQSTT